MDSTLQPPPLRASDSIALLLASAHAPLSHPEEQPAGTTSPSCEQSSPSSRAPTNSPMDDSCVMDFGEFQALEAAELLMSARRKRLSSSAFVAVAQANASDASPADVKTGASTKAAGAIKAATPAYRTRRSSATCESNPPPASMRRAESFSTIGAAHTESDEEYKPKRSARTSPDNSIDFRKRDDACARALQVPSLREYFENISPHKCEFVAVYPCKDVACFKTRRECPHPVSRFQSTRNSKRHVHAMLFYKLVKGVDCNVPDEALRKVWKFMSSECMHGLKSANGHGMDPTGRTCVNPHHYSLAQGIDIDCLPDGE